MRETHENKISIHQHVSVPVQISLSIFVVVKICAATFPPQELSPGTRNLWRILVCLNLGGLGSRLKVTTDLMS